MNIEANYGIALNMAESYNAEDKETFDVIRNTFSRAEMVSSMLFLSHIMIATLPKGKWSQPPLPDLRDELTDAFADYLSGESIHISAFTYMDIADINAATGAVFLNSIMPMAEGSHEISVPMVHEGIDDYTFDVILAAISKASVMAFVEYCSVVEQFKSDGVNSFESALRYLKRLLPVILSRSTA